MPRPAVFHYVVGTHCFRSAVGRCTYAGVPSDTEAEHQIKDRNYATDDDMRGRVGCVQILVTMSLSEVTWRT